jgi:hypothetical protein
MFNRKTKNKKQKHNHSNANSPVGEARAMRAMPLPSFLRASASFSGRPPAKS